VTVANASGPLVLITRPGPLAAEWVAQLSATGVRAAALPLIDIAPVASTPSLHAMWQGLAPGALVMFVSPNAVVQWFQGLDQPLAWPAGVLAGATGPGTVAALQSHGVALDQIVAPAADAPQFDSEALWARLQHQDWRGRPVWIVRGDGGRDWMAQTLTQAGAQVSFLQAYRRLPAQWTDEQQAWARQAVAQAPDVRWHLSSSESLEALSQLLPDLPRATSIAWATHPRIAHTARSFGFGRVLEIRPGWPAVLAALQTQAAA